MLPSWRLGPILLLEGPDSHGNTFLKTVEHQRTVPFLIIHPTNHGMRFPLDASIVLSLDTFKLCTTRVSSVTLFSPWKNRSSFSCLLFHTWYLCVSKTPARLKCHMSGRQFSSHHLGVWLNEQIAENEKIKHTKKAGNVISQSSLMGSLHKI